MECVLGRLLTPGEVVHHVDHCRVNNQPMNLRVLAPSDHSRLHPSPPRPRPPLPDEQVRAALARQSVDLALSELGIGRRTLIRHYSHLLDEREDSRRKYRTTPDEYALLRELAGNPALTRDAAADRLGWPLGLLERRCRELGVAWTLDRRGIGGRPTHRQ